MNLHILDFPSSYTLQITMHFLILTPSAHSSSNTTSYKSSPLKTLFKIPLYYPLSTSYKKHFIAFCNCCRCFCCWCCCIFLMHLSLLPCGFWVRGYHHQDICKLQNAKRKRGRQRVEGKHNMQQVAKALRNICWEKRPVTKCRHCWKNAAWQWLPLRVTEGEARRRRQTDTPLGCVSAS